jgi:hypothetical protein
MRPGYARSQRREGFVLGFGRGRLFPAFIAIVKDRGRLGVTHLPAFVLIRTASSRRMKPGVFLAWSAPLANRLWTQ